MMAGHVGKCQRRSALLCSACSCKAYEALALPDCHVMCSALPHDSTPNEGAVKMSVGLSGTSSLREFESQAW